MSEPSEIPADRRRARRVLLVGWDAADWRMIDPLVEAGLMPNLKRLLDGGVMGNIASLSPMISPILWTSIATGKNADKHDILGFAEPDGTTGKVRPVTSTSRRCKALWNILSDHGLRSGVVNWFATHPAEPIDGFVVTDRFPHPAGPGDRPWPAVPGSVTPDDLLEELCALRVHPAQTTPQQIRPFVPGLREGDPADSEELRQIRVMLANCATVHAATTHLMQTREWDFLGVYHDAIDRFGHAFMQYHPPRRPDVDEEACRRYGDVCNGCYRFHDMMLGRLLELAGDDTTVIIVSDHGFHSDELRPEGTSRIAGGQPVSWHRPYGVLVIHGPGIRRDERVYGASLLDVAPTVLAMLGLPVAEDMDGQVLAQVFDTPVAVRTVPTYEDGAAAASAAPDDDPWVAQQMLEQLKALGYLAGDDTGAIVEDRIRNLGQVYLSTGRPKLALAQFEELLERRADDQSARIGIASAHMQLGDLDACETAARAVLDADAGKPQASLYLGIIHYRRGDHETALARLRDAEAKDPGLAGLHTHIGQVYLRMRRWEDAERAFTTALARDADDAEAHDGLGIASRELGQPARAVYEHMEAIGRLHHRPQSHINLALVLARIGRIPWAIRAFETALEMAPDHPVAHQGLAQLYARDDRDVEKAAHHRRRAEEILARLEERKRGGTAGPTRPPD